MPASTDQKLGKSSILDWRAKREALEEAQKKKPDERGKRSPGQSKNPSVKEASAAACLPHWKRFVNAFGEVGHGQAA